MHDAAPASSAVPICPRCGYDQSGVVATWDTACPLRGLCSECGLDFNWAMVLAPEVLGPRWSVEHGSTLTIVRLFRATWCAIPQRRLWHRLDIAFPLRPARLWALVAVSVLLLHLLLAAAVATPPTIHRLVYGWAHREPWDPSLWLFPYDNDVEVPLRVGAWLHMPVGPLILLIGTTLVIPGLVLLIFTQTMSRVGVRREHVLRGFAYAAPAAGPAMFIVLAVVVGLMYADNRFTMVDDAVWQLCAFVTLCSWPIVQTLRWRSFVKHYLRLPHAGWIALSMLAILSLTFITSLVLLSLFITHW